MIQPIAVLIIEELTTYHVHNTVIVSSIDRISGDGTVLSLHIKPADGGEGDVGPLARRVPPRPKKTTAALRETIAPPKTQTASTHGARASRQCHPIPMSGPPSPLTDVPLRQHTPTPPDPASPRPISQTRSAMIRPLRMARSNRPMRLLSSAGWRKFMC